MTWHGVRLNAPDWGHDSHTLAATLRLLGGQGQLHIIVNAYWQALEFELPPAGDGPAAWRRVVDTFLESPDDVRAWAGGAGARGRDLRRAAPLRGAAVRARGWPA